MARKYSTKKAKKDSGASMSAPDKMLILVTVINRNKTEFYVDLLLNFEVNLQLILNAHGTANAKHIELLGLTDSDKAVIFSAIRSDRASEAMAALEEKFKTVKGGKGIAYTIPMSSTVGVAIYQFLSNKK